jgi:hypothetical protein
MLGLTLVTPDRTTIPMHLFCLCSISSNPTCCNPVLIPSAHVTFLTIIPTASKTYTNSRLGNKKIHPLYSSVGEVEKGDAALKIYLIKRYLHYNYNQKHIKNYNFIANPQKQTNLLRYFAKHISFPSAVIISPLVILSL